MADYALLSDLHTYLGVDITDTTNDAAMSMAITAASSAIDRATNRQFGPQDSNAVTRYYTADRPAGLQPFLMPSTMFNYWFPFQSGFLFPDGCVPVDDIFLTGQTLGNITAVDHTTGASLTIDRLWPFNADKKGMPFTAVYFAPSVSLPRGEGGVEITAKFGWVNVPTTIKNACLLQATRYLKRKDSPFGVAGSTATGETLRLLDKLDPDVEMMIADFRRMWAVAAGGPFSNGATY